MPPWTAKNLAYGQKCKLREITQWNITKIVDNMSDLKTEMHQIRYRLGSTPDRSNQTPDPAGGDYSAPRPLEDLRGPTS